MMYDIQSLKDNHVNNYRKALVEIINNNTNALFDEDISSLIKKPPLDSMDLIKSKFLDLAKKNKIVLNADVLAKIIDSYRKKCLETFEKLKDVRISELSKLVNNYSLEKDSDVIKINKKDFTVINKKVKSEMKEIIKLSLNQEIIDKVNELFSNDVDSSVVKKITSDVSKYINGNYQRQLLENIDFKILVKDTILINSFKEQSDRYLFTLENSRIFEIE